MPISCLADLEHQSIVKMSNTDRPNFSDISDEEFIEATRLNEDNYSSF